LASFLVLISLYLEAPSKLYIFLKHILY
jgi:hypothetical protein